MDRVLAQLDSGKLTLTKHQLYCLVGIDIEGGSDTTAPGILAFIKAIASFPELQKKAQAEIDAVIGQDRTPQWSDYEKLRYVSQVLKESMIWLPIGGAAVPHALSARWYFHDLCIDSQLDLRNEWKPSCEYSTRSVAIHFQSVHS